MTQYFVLRTPGDVFYATSSKQPFVFDPRWTEVKLSGSRLLDLGEDGGRYLAEALMRPNSVAKLDLSGTNVRGTQYIGDALRCNTTLTELDISGNDGLYLKEIADGLRKNTTLRKLSIFRHSYVTYEGVNAIRDMLKVNKTLTSIDHTYVPQHVAYSIVEVKELVEENHYKSLGYTSRPSHGELLMRMMLGDGPTQWPAKNKNNTNNSNTNGSHSSTNNVTHSQNDSHGQGQPVMHSYVTDQSNNTPGDMTNGVYQPNNTGYMTYQSNTTTTGTAGYVSTTNFARLPTVPQHSNTAWGSYQQQPHHQQYYAANEIAPTNVAADTHSFQIYSSFGQPPPTTAGYVNTTNYAQLPTVPQHSNTAWGSYQQQPHQQYYAPTNFQSYSSFAQPPPTTVIYGGQEQQKSYVEMNRKEIDAVKGMALHGSKTDGTEAAHIISHELSKGVLAHVPGPKTTATAPQLIEILQSAENLKIKARDSNQIGDRRDDAKIIYAVANNEPLTDQRTIHRAKQIYDKGQEFGGAHPTVDVITERVGQLVIHTGEPGRPRTVASTVNARPVTDFDLRSSSVQNGNVKFKADSTVDKRCSTYKSGELLLTKNGAIDQRSAVVRSGKLNLKPSASPSYSGSSSSSSRSSSSGPLKANGTPDRRYSSNRK